MNNQKKRPVKDHQSAALFTLFITFTIGSAIAANALIKTKGHWATSSGTVTTIPTTTTTSTPTTTTTSTTTTTQPTTTTGVPVTQLGINLTQPTYFSPQRSFSNLLIGSSWYYTSATSGWANMPADHLDADQVVTYLDTGERAIRILTVPNGIYAGTPVQIRCSFVGSGTIDIGNTTITGISRSGNSLTFTWTPPSSWVPSTQIKPAFLSITRTDPSNPVRKVDCREASASPTALFDPAFVQEVSKYKVARFMKWQEVEANKSVTWATRARASGELLRGPDGVPLEIMVALANQSNIDPWFAMPWNADEEYVRNFATYVRDNLSPGRKVYVEMSNEVWNMFYPVATQARNEGVAAGLSADPFVAQLFRYSQKTAWALKIWTDVFAAEPDRLVRVTAGMNQSAWVNGMILKYGDTAVYTDAFATAPYFGDGLLNGTNATATIADTDQLFSQLSTKLATTISETKANADLVRSYGKRFITYEGGQHIVSSTNVTMVGVLNRDPRMGQLYTQFLTQWQQQFGDLNTLFADAAFITQYGAWGLQEYPGQPASNAPKYAAVMNFKATLP